MSNAIRNTITSTLAAQGVSAIGYGRHIDAVVEALTEREYALTDRIVEALVTHTSLSRHDIVSHGAAIGLLFRPTPAPAAEPTVEVREFEAEFNEEVAAADYDAASDVESVEETEIEVSVTEPKGSKGKRIAKLEAQQAEIMSTLNNLVDLANRHLGTR